MGKKQQVQDRYGLRQEIGPDTKHIGEVINTDTLYQAQLAATFAALLGFDFKPGHSTMQPVRQIISK